MLINACSKSLPGGGAGPRPQAFVPSNVETMATPLLVLLIDLHKHLLFTAGNLWLHITAGYISRERA